MAPILSFLPFLTLASAAVIVTTTAPATTGTIAAPLITTAPIAGVHTTTATIATDNTLPAAPAASASAADVTAFASDTAFFSGATYPSATGPIVDECGPTIPDPSVDDTCYSPVQQVDTPHAYGVQCLNDTVSTPINITSCAELIPIMCAQEWQEAGQWLWISNHGCSLGSFLSPYNGSAVWPSAENCELLIYAAMVDECAYSGIPYNIAAVNLKKLPQNLGQGSNVVVGTGEAVNVGYGSYLIADRQLRNLSDASNCETVPYVHAPPTPVACAGGNGGPVQKAVNLPIPTGL